MTIIIFPGLGVSVKRFNYDYDEKTKKYKPSYFMKKLKQITNVFVVDRPYVNTNYYKDNTDSMYDSINSIPLDSINLDTAIKNMYKNLDKKKYKAPYIVLGHSHGIYYAIEFARQYPNKTKCIISLDGSWITNELCQIRLDNWKDKGKIVEEIKNQSQLDIMLNNIKKDGNTNSLMNSIVYNRTSYCMKHHFENITKKIEFIIFRDFNSNTLSLDKTTDDMNKNFNNLAIKEYDILKNNKYYKHFWLLDAGHNVMEHPIYRKQIIDYIGNLC